MREPGREGAAKAAAATADMADRFPSLDEFDAGKARHLFHAIIHA